MAATTEHIATKMVFQYQEQDGKRNWTFANVPEGITNLNFNTLADAINNLQNTPYSSLFKTVQSEIVDA